MIDLVSVQELMALATVIAIDVVLAGDNAIVIGMAAARLAPEQRRRAILIGIGLAVAIRIALAGVAVRLLHIIGLTLAGGLLLLWVVWKMWREFRTAGESGEEAAGTSHRRKTLGQAVVQILFADLSMSLDNVLAVAGAARESPFALVLGLGVSVLLTGVAADYLARLLSRHRWLAYAGLLIIFGVALDMIASDLPRVVRMAGILG